MNHRKSAIEARSCIRKRYNDGLRFRKIAQLIGRSPGTVSGERNRGRAHMYDIPSSHRAKETRENSAGKRQGVFCSHCRKAATKSAVV